jgi:TnpA family transposase
MHPTYRALAELGKVIKTIFLCQYLSSEPLRREINQGLNVVENWNNANGFIFYGKGKEIATNRLEDQEIAVLSLHLLQSCLLTIENQALKICLSCITKGVRFSFFKSLIFKKKCCYLSY